MSERSSFFNSVGGDRLYDASDFAEFFKSLFINGVFPTPATILQVTDNADMTVTVAAGEAWINGYHYVNDDDLVLTIEVAGGVLNRIDRIALRMDVTNRSIVAIVKKGEFGSTPVAPVLLRDIDGYELGIADIYIGAGVTSIVAANITDLRANAAYCGWVDMALSGITAAGRALLDDANAAAQIATLGITATAAELNALDGITATVTELNYTDGVTSAIQTQLGDKLALAGGTMTGVLYSQANTSYTTSQVRNVIESTGDASGGGNGDIWIKYTA